MNKNIDTTEISGLPSYMQAGFDLSSVSGRYAAVVENDSGVLLFNTDPICLNEFEETPFMTLFNINRSTVNRAMEALKAMPQDLRATSIDIDAPDPTVDVGYQGKARGGRINLMLHGPVTYHFSNDHSGSDFKFYPQESYPVIVHDGHAWFIEAASISKSSSPTALRLALGNAGNDVEYTVSESDEDDYDLVPFDEVPSDVLAVIEKLGYSIIPLPLPTTRLHHG